MTDTEHLVDIRITDDAWCRAEMQTRTVVEVAVAAVLDHAAPSLPPAELSIMLTDSPTIAGLNQTWRGRTGPTNVLSFPADTHAPSEGRPRLLGDVVLAYEVLEAEARQAGLPLSAHLSHLVIHGVLHLLGHDHETTEEAETMERCEVEILRTLGIANPYSGAAQKVKASLL